MGKSTISMAIFNSFFYVYQATVPQRQLYVALRRRQRNQAQNWRMMRQSWIGLDGKGVLDFNVFLLMNLELLTFLYY